MKNTLDSENELIRITEKLNVINEVPFDFDIDTLSIIEQGTYIRETKQAMKEFSLFILSSIIILSLIVVMILQLGMTTWMLMQIVMIVIVPWLVIPILAHQRKAGEV